jgi:hypothetical protein
LISKNFDKIIDFLIAIGITIGNAAISMFKTLFIKVKTFVSNVFGKSEVFITEGDLQITLNSLYLKLASDTYFDHFSVKYYDEYGNLKVEDKTVAIIEVKPYSRKNSFDSQKIAIKYEFDCINNNEEDNSAPTTPVIASDTSNVLPLGEESQYFFKSTDPDNDKIRYLIDWGDGGDEEFTLLYKSDEVAKASHLWKKTGIYTISITAYDEHGEKSKSDLEIGPIEIKEEDIPRDYLFIRFKFLNRFFT